MCAMHPRLLLRCAQTHCDAYVQSELPSYPAGRLRRILSTSRTGKARLLHYFPYAEEGAPAADAGAPASAPPSESSWCGWHNDHGSLTGEGGTGETAGGGSAGALTLVTPQA